MSQTKLKSFIENGKTYLKISDLLLWNENPRGIKTEDFEALEEKIKKFGELRPMIINSGKFYGTPGQTAGGNMRLRVFQKLNHDKAWVEIRDIKDEQEFLELAIVDNTEFGYWEPDLLAELLLKHRGTSIEALKLQLANPIGIESLLANYAGQEGREVKFTAQNPPADLSGGLPTTNECPSCGYKY